MTQSILSSLLTPEQLEKLGQIWPEQTVVQQGPRERLPPLFNSPLLQSVAAITDAYQGRTLAGDKHDSDYMSAIPAKEAGKMVEKGVTVYLEDVTSTLPEGEAFSKQLEEELGIPAGSVRIAIFISPPGNGAACHFDTLDVISVQLIGNKRFSIAKVEEIDFPYGIQYGAQSLPEDNLFPQITKRFPDYADSHFEQINMQPGSVLFMPRGTWHYTDVDEQSMAVSIALSPPTPVDEILHQLKSTLLQDAAWRRPHYGFNQPSPDLGPLYKKLPRVMHQIIQRETDADSASKFLTKYSRYLRIPRVEVEITQEAANWIVLINKTRADGKPVKGRLSVPRETAEVFNWLKDQEAPFKVKQVYKAFPSLPHDFILEVLKAADQSGLIRFLWFDPIPG